MFRTVVMLGYVPGLAILTTALRGQIRNPKLEIRNKHQIQMTNPQNPTNQPARGGLVLRTCSFVDWNLFRISSFGFCPPFLPNRRCPAEENVGQDQAL